MSAQDRDIPGLVVILAGARSGSSLLRVLLDAHPAIGCPGEADLPALMARLCDAWSVVTQAEDANGLRRDLPDDAIAEVRRTVGALMRAYCHAHEKQVYCDKSLGSDQYVEIVSSLFPDARFILLFRHVMDTVASGLEASPFGFGRYGYLPFVQASPDNLVLALVRYWCHHVELALAWERHRPDRCHRLLYEDLVGDPASTIAGVCRFLGVPFEPRMLTTPFESPLAPVGPTDHKLPHTNHVGSASVGSGKRVPVALIPSPLLSHTNSLLRELGFPAITTEWNVDPVGVAGQGTTATHSLAEIMAAVALGWSAVDRSTMPPFCIGAQDVPGLQWLVDDSTVVRSPGHGEATAVITGSASDLADMILATNNLGALLRSGRVRHLGQDGRLQSDSVEQLMREVAALRAAWARGSALSQDKLNGAPPEGAAEDE